MLESTEYTPVDPEKLDEIFPCFVANYFSGEPCLRCEDYPVCRKVYAKEFVEE